MRLIIEARLEGGEESATDTTIVAVVERKDRSLADLGLTLAEGRALLAEVQSFLVRERSVGASAVRWGRSPIEFVALDAD
ncbi:hypothetical protein BZM27_27295 [Paraburkholderia steynii]|uniref:Uncharacterized protein n=1 Tax=Paraburkholderia steynii TaxID=1245441 RepID=A0A4R0X8D6_9BURK|nr:hypothetical protein BZM27_27295 [Paraburkholderia steynii]